MRDREMARRVNRLLPMAVLFLLLTACGGGGGGGGSSPTTLTLTPVDVKTFRFAWPDASGETEYRLLENPDGASGYTQVQTLPADTTSTELIVSLPARLNASYILQSCDAGGCTNLYEVFVSGTLASAIGYVKASNPGSSDFFGGAIALSADGTTLAVSARGEDSSADGIDGDQADISAFSAGAVYVFVRDTSGLWTQQAYIKASNSDPTDNFGIDVALSADGDTLAVGALREDSDAVGVGGSQGNTAVQDSGAVYVFTRSVAGVWSQQAYIKASNTDQDDFFGDTVALSADGNTLAVGAPGEASNATGVDNGPSSGTDASAQDDSAPAAGAVYVFTRDGTPTWSQQAYLKASNAQAGDDFGVGISLSADGNTLAVSATDEASTATGIDGDETDNSAPSAGAVYVFTRSGVTWSQQAYIKASNMDGGDDFGLAVYLSGDGDTLAVGAIGEESALASDPNDDTLSNAGAVYVFTRNGMGTWSEQAYLKASTIEGSDLFGRAIALSNDGDILVTSASGESSAATGLDGAQGDNTLADSGAAYVFTRDSGGTWSQQAYLKAPNPDARDFFGVFVTISADGATVAVGSTGEDSNATGIGGNQAENFSSPDYNSGAVYLY